MAKSVKQKRPRSPAPAASGPSNRRAATREAEKSKAADGQKQQPSITPIYGRHAAAAVLANPDRVVEEIWVTPKAGQWLADAGHRDRLVALGAREISPPLLDAMLPPGSVHQGVALLARPLIAPDLAVLADIGTGPILVLDQITDPQNIGAIFRAAAAFGARGLVAQDRRTPPLTGALAKAAAGTIEQIPLISVVNIARSLDSLKVAGFAVWGLAGEGATEICPADEPDRLVLVLGAEGAGLRPNVARHCDRLLRIPIAATVESLNVATAAAVALYAATRSG